MPPAAARSEDNTQPTLTVAWMPRPGEYVALLADGRFCILRNAVRYEVADGDLIVTSKAGNVWQWEADDWAAIGTYEECEGGGYIAIEAFGEVVSQRPGS